MRLKINIALFKQLASRPIAEAPQGHRMQNLFVLACRSPKATLDLLPESERERVEEPSKRCIRSMQDVIRDIPTTNRNDANSHLLQMTNVDLNGWVV